MSVKLEFQNNIRLVILLLASVFMITDCEKIQFGEPYNCRIGTRYWPGDDLSFTIDSIRDYRCPKDMMCFWSGDVDIWLSVNINLNRIDTLLRLYGNNYFETDNYSFKVLEVYPWPRSFEKTCRNAYRVKMIVEKKWP
jgi:hypothetical protein